MHAHAKTSPGSGAAYADAYRQAATRGRQPARPMLFPPGCQSCERFDDLAGLARRLHQLRGARGLQLRPSTFAFGDLPTMLGLAAFAFAKDGVGGDEWLANLWLAGQTQVELEHALRDENPLRRRAA